MNLRRVSILVGLVAMVLAIIATLVTGGSLLQKVLFLIAVPTLGITAYMNRQWMFAGLQAVATLGAILAFFPSVLENWRYVILIGVAIIVTCKLIHLQYFKDDSYGSLGGLGLFLIAAGLATDPVTHNIQFNSLLASGGLIVALYSIINYFKYNVKIALIWVVLNILFSINPLRLVLF